MPKPSFGCLTCRSRRVRCDGRRSGGCINCANLWIVCGGYLSDIDVLMRDQTKKTIQRQKQRGAPVAEEIALISRSEPTNSIIELHAIDRSLTLSPSEIEQLAIGAFYTRWCIDSSAALSSDQLNSQNNGCLLASIKLLGIDTIGEKWLLDSCGPLYRQRLYLEAVQKLNQALQSPLTTKKDSTLLATAILAMYEAKSGSSIETYKQHLKGSAALLELRGEAQVTSPLGAMLYMQLCGQVYTCFLLERKPVPEGLVKLRAKISEQLVDSNDVHWPWLGVLMRFVNFVAKVQPDITSRRLSAARSGEIIAGAVQLLQELDEVFERAALSCQYIAAHAQISSTESNEQEVASELQHVYPTYSAAMLWSARRDATITLLDIINVVYGHCEASVNIDLDASELYYARNARALLDVEAREFLAMMPQMMAHIKQHLGTPSKRAAEAEWVGKAFEDESPLSAMPFPSSSASDTAFFQMRFQGDWLAKFGLYHVSLAGSIDRDLRKRMCDILADLAKCTNAQQPALLAQDLQARLDLEGSS